MRSTNANGFKMPPFLYFKMSLLEIYDSRLIFSQIKRDKYRWKENDTIEQKCPLLWWALGSNLGCTQDKVVKLSWKAILQPQQTELLNDKCQWYQKFRKYFQMLTGIESFSNI